MEEEESDEIVKLDDIKLVSQNKGQTYEPIKDKTWVIEYFKTPKGKV